MIFNFRIIICEDGSEIIDRSMKTPYNSLTAIQMVEYAEMDNRLYAMDRLKREKQKKQKRQQKRDRNLLYKLACVCGLNQIVRVAIKINKDMEEY